MELNDERDGLRGLRLDRIGGAVGWCGENEKEKMAARGGDDGNENGAL